MLRNCLALSVDGSGTAIHPKRRCLMDVYFRRCEGRLALDWMCLREISSNFHEKRCGGNSLMVRNCLSLWVDGCGAAITFKMAMFDRCVFWEV